MLARGIACVESLWRAALTAITAFRSTSTLVVSDTSTLAVWATLALGATATRRVCTSHHRTTLLVSLRVPSKTSQTLTWMRQWSHIMNSSVYQSLQKKFSLAIKGRELRSWEANNCEAEAETEARDSGRHCWTEFFTAWKKAPFW